jgi:hypothetical protein
MFENLLVAFSNVPAIYSIYNSFTMADYLTCGAISFVAGASFVSHLVENHKHGMPGIGFSQKTSYYLNRMDVLGCALVGTRFLYLYYSKYGLSLNVLLNNKLTFANFAFSFIFLRISEYDKYNPKLKKLYITTHCIWHVVVFSSMNYFLLKFIYG